MLSSGESKPSIVFFGSGPVAAASLSLLSKNFNIECVVTKPRPPHHKGEVPVLTLAEQLQLPVTTAENKKTLSGCVNGQDFTSIVAVLIDFGIIVEQDVIDKFPLGIVNSHFSLLPEWRGADPIAFSLLSGQKETGVSLMLLVQAMDEGPLLAQAPLEIVPTDTITTLTDSLVELSFEALTHVLPLYIDGKVTPAPQESVTMASSPIPTYSRKLTKSDAVLDFTKPAEILEREIRAFIEWPKSKTVIAGADVIITRAHVMPSEDGVTHPAGTIVTQGNTLLAVATSKDMLVIDEIKPAGKNAMTSQAFLNGYGAKI